MRRVLTILWIACWTVLITEPTAAAMTPLHRAVLIADAHWPASPCHGRERVVVAPALIPPGALAYTPPGGCTVFVEWRRMRGMPFREKCRLLVHEFGHMAGFGHRSDLASVMYPTLMDVATNTLDCYRAFPSDAPRVDDGPQWKARTLTMAKGIG